VRKSSTRWKALLAVVFAASLVAAACGDDGGTSTASSTGTSGSTASTGKTGSTGTGSTGSGSTAATGTTKKATVAGCEKGYTDPADVSLTRTVARCSPGAPAPVPLATKTKIIIASSFKLEFNSPVSVANTLGEFAKENLEVEFVNLTYANSIPQLDNGQVDVAIGGFETAEFNAGAAGLSVRAVAGNYFPPKAGNYTVPQTGLWCRRDSFTTPASPILKELETKKWATSVGKGSSAIYYSTAEILKKVPDFNIKKVDIQAVPSTDIVAALKNKAIDCGILLDPLWTQFKDDPAYFQAATQTPGEPLGQMSFGKNLLKDKPEVGQAFMRAYIRTVNTYFAGNYHLDDKVMAEIQKFTGATDASQAVLKTQDPLTFDWEIRKDTVVKVQQLFIDLGVITNYTVPVTEDKIVDRSVYEKVLGVK
jgi:NitT/TauT family transport system substrate-binding protein